MGFVARNSGATAVSDGVAGNARMNKAGEIVSTPWELQMMLEGRIFVAGTGVEEAGISGVADFSDETTPIVGLVAPAGGVVMLPLWIKIYYDTEAAAAPANTHLMYVQKTKAAFSAGTEKAAINCLGGANPRAAQGKLQVTLSSLTAITSDENVALTSRLHVLDNLMSGEMIAEDANVETFAPSPLELIWTPSFPIGLYYGSGIYFYAIDATAKYNVAAAWIELPASIYKP